MFLNVFAEVSLEQHLMACSLSAGRCKGNRNELSSRDIDASDVTIPLPESFMTPNED